MPRGVYERTEETKRRISESNKGKISPFLGRKHTLEARAKISKEKSGENHPQFGLKGSNSWKWTGGKSVSRGYVLCYVPDHSNCYGKGQVLEHRLVMEDCLGRYLTKEEVVHHINGIKNDNRIENLRLFANRFEHRECHAEMQRLEASLV